MKNPNRATLLINLSVEEAESIRSAARRQDRTISAYVLRVVMSRIKIEEQLSNRDLFLEKYMERTRGGHRNTLRFEIALATVA